MEALGQVNSTGFTRGIEVGIIGSFVGTIMMDLVIIGQCLIMGLPALTYLELIGSVFGGGVPLGVLIHVLTTIVLGILVSVPLLKINALRVNTARKGLVLGFLAGVLSISACVPFAILIGESIATVLMFMTVPHLVWGIGFGIVAGYGMPPLVR